MRVEIRTFGDSYDSLKEFVSEVAKPLRALGDQSQTVHIGREGVEALLSGVLVLNLAWLSDPIPVLIFFSAGFLISSKYGEQLLEQAKKVDSVWLQQKPRKLITYTVAYLAVQKYPWLFAAFFLGLYSGQQFRPKSTAVHAYSKLQTMSAGLWDFFQRSVKNKAQ